MYGRTARKETERPMWKPLRCERLGRFLAHDVHLCFFIFFFSSRRRHTRYIGDWSSDVCSSDLLDANTWFNNFNGSQCAAGDTACLARNARPADKKNDYGGTLGGPVWIPKLYNGHDKTFFFFSWEQLGYKLGATNTTTVPTDAMRGGDLSSPATFRTDRPPIGTNPC